MKIFAKRGSTTVNLVILLVAILVMAAAFYYLAARDLPYSYSSSGNVVRFNLPVYAKACEGKVIEFPITDKLNVKVTATKAAADGVFEVDCKFDLEITGSKSGMRTTLPFTRKELELKIEEEFDNQFELLKQSEEKVPGSRVINLQTPELQPGEKREKYDPLDNLDSRPDDTDVDEETGSQDEDPADDDPKEEEQAAGEEDSAGTEADDTDDTSADKAGDNEESNNSDG